MAERALITGASAGAGRSLAHRFARSGFDLVLVARRHELLVQLKAEIERRHNVGVDIHSADLRDIRQVNDVYDDAIGDGIDLLINNAGLGDWNFVWDVDLDKYLAMIQLNAIATAMLSTRYVKDMKDVGGCLINVASLAGYALFPGSIPYSSTKFFVTALTEVLAREVELSGSPLRVKVMTPGPIDTEFTATSLADTKLPRADPSSIVFHSPDEIAEFTYQLYESDRPVGLVDLETMQFRLSDSLHPVGRLRNRSTAQPPDIASQ